MINNICTNFIVLLENAVNDCVNKKKAGVKKPSLIKWIFWFLKIFCRVPCYMKNIWNACGRPRQDVLNDNRKSRYQKAARKNFIETTMGKLTNNFLSGDVKSF